MTGEWNKSHTQDKKGEPNVRSWSIIDKEKKKKKNQEEWSYKARFEEASPTRVRMS